MNETAITVIGYIAWMMLVVFVIVGMRVKAVLSGKKSANDFDPSGKDLSDFAVRLARVHANCYEHFPILVGLLLYTLALEITEITNDLALYLLIARIAQGVIHLISTQVMAVKIRLTLFLIQYLIASYWIIQILRMFIFHR